ncbi:hypothetical protein YASMINEVIRUS_1389 [Yasminevirus sp. GU-2018]|uniref:Uncharacterized protein n=1 Tax=Yasminevirus sp. GU-2018 TaxID=2420051 RepID=A0A5K0UA38_9VIRU|nr:hypothetical protein YASMINEVIRUS_1389 [Yasminevirus sp. GU-2018]
MASLQELDETLPAHFTLSNRNLIVIARAREESVFFYDSIDRNTTIVLLAEPNCYPIKRIFLEFMTDIGATVIDLREKESFDSNYKMTKRSQQILAKLITENSYDKIITHPKYSRNNDPQNREIFDFVSLMVRALGTNNHYTYNKIGVNGNPKLPCKVKMGIFELYCRMGNNNDEINRQMLQNYINISSNISGIRRVVASDMRQASD